MRLKGSINLLLSESSHRNIQSLTSPPINKMQSGFFETLASAEMTTTSSADERKVRSRERNRVHAQKTRQRKKEQMQSLQQKAEELKKEQIRLRQTINEKSTATILVRLFAEGAKDSSITEEDPLVEELLRRSTEEIPDSSKIPELPALILPGQHASKKMRVNSNQYDHPDDGIDYELLGKDRSQCTREELDQIRRERNRMHAKRTRDRKRLYIEKLGEMCRQLEDENIILHQHLKKIDPEHVVPPRTTMNFKTVSTQSSPKMQPTSHPAVASVSANPSTEPQTLLLFDRQISTLLKAAECERHEISDVASAADEEPYAKRQRLIR